MIFMMIQIWGSAKASTSYTCVCGSAKAMSKSRLGLQKVCSMAFKFSNVFNSDHWSSVQLVLQAMFTRNLPVSPISFGAVINECESLGFRVTRLKGLRTCKNGPGSDLFCICYVVLCCLISFLRPTFLIVCLHIRSYTIVIYIVCVCLSLFSLMCVHIPVSFMCSHCKHLFRMQ